MLQIFCWSSQFPQTARAVTSDGAGRQQIQTLSVVVSVTATYLVMRGGITLTEKSSQEAGDVFSSRKNGYDTDSDKSRVLQTNLFVFVSMSSRMT